MNRRPSRQSYPLSALFILIAACAVITALITPLARSVVDGKVGVVETTYASFLGAVIVMLVGAVVGSYHYRRLRGMLWGLLTGAGIGLIIGPVALSPVHAFPSLITMSAGGALVLIVAGTAFRLSSRS